MQASYPSIRFLICIAAMVTGTATLLLTVWFMSQLITPQTLERQLYKIFSVEFLNVHHQKRPEQLSEPPTNSADTPPPEPLTAPSKIAIPVDLPTPSDIKEISLPTPSLSLDLDLSNLLPTSYEANPPQQSNIPQFDEALYPLLNTQPLYPRRAKRAKIEGWVNIAFTINTKGQVEDIEVLAAQPEGIFESATLNAVENWTFKPQFLAGKPSARRVVQTIKFELDK